jgi:nitroreductase
VELIEAMTTTGTCRRYLSDTVPEDVLVRAFSAARFAPQGGNLQPVRWVVVRDAGRRRALADLYLPLWQDYLRSVMAGERKVSAAPRSIQDADYFAEHLSEVPLMLVACVKLRRLQATDADLGRLSIVGGASVYPMVQNVCLALRNEGVATALTTLLCRREPEVRRLLDIPPDIATACHVAAGYPERPWPRRLSRLPVSDIVFVDRYGTRLRAENVRTDEPDAAA